MNPLQEPLQHLHHQQKLLHLHLHLHLHLLHQQNQVYPQTLL